MIVVGTLAKVLLVLGLLGVVGYDAVAMSINSLSLKDDATAAAQAGHQVLHERKDPKAAYARRAATTPRSTDSPSCPRPSR